VDYCESKGLVLHDRRFSIRYSTTIPRQVGLAGSSAIITATLRALMEFYGVTVPKQVQPSLVLSVERDDLKIGAGLQDRVIQAYEGLVYMDFSKDREELVDGYRCYAYEPLDPARLPPVYIAFHDALSEPTEVFHNDIRGRFDRGEPAVVRAMLTFADIAARGRDALLAGDRAELHRLANLNFDTRRSIFNLAPWQIAQVETARSCGASAKFAGSGGTIVGFYDDDAMLARLRDALGAQHSRVVVPTIQS
jgi:glucuronokinase